MKTFFDSLDDEWERKNTVALMYEEWAVIRNAQRWEYIPGHDEWVRQAWDAAEEAAKGIDPEWLEKTKAHYDRLFETVH